MSRRHDLINRRTTVRSGVRPRRRARLIAGSAVLASFGLVAADAALAAPGDIELVSRSTAGEIGNDDTSVGFASVDISADGRYVVFESAASNLVDGDTNGVSDVFRRDRQTGETIRVSVGAAGEQGDSLSITPSISDDGRYVAFESNAGSFGTGDGIGRDVFRKDLTTDAIYWVSEKPSDATNLLDTSGGVNPHISADGMHVVYTTVGLYQWAWSSSAPQNSTAVIVRDISDGSHTLVNKSASGDVPLNGAVGASASSPRLDEDGDTVIWTTNADNLVDDDTHGDIDAFVRDLSSDVNVMVSADADGVPVDNGGARFPTIDDTGDTVAFESTTAILGEDHLGGGYYVRNLATGVLTDPVPGGSGRAGTLSGDGEWLGLWAKDDLDPAVSSALNQAYLVELETGRVRAVSRRFDGVDAGSHAHVFAPVVPSKNGEFIAFGSRSGDLVDGDDNVKHDAFVVERPTFGPEIISLIPARLLETRDAPELTTIDGLFEGDGRLSAGSETEIDVVGRGGIAADGTDAVVINVTAISPTERGFVTVYPCGERPLASSLNYGAAGAVVGNELIAKLSDSGSVCVYTSAETDLTIDSVGSVPSASPLNSLAPGRVLDTRVGDDVETVDGRNEGEGPIVGDTFIELDLTRRAGVPSSGVEAVIMNVTAINPEGRGFVTVYPCGDRPDASSLNFSSAGAVVGNELIAKVSDRGSVCLYASATTELTVDVVGYLSTGALTTPLDPARILETRSDPSLTTVDGLFQGEGQVGADPVLELDVTGRGGVPAFGVGSVIINITAINPDGRGFVTVYPCGDRPNASSLNFSAAGVVVGNELVAKVSGAGNVCVYSSTATHMTADIVGFVPVG